MFLFHITTVKKTVCPNELLYLRLNRLLIFYHKANNHFSLLLILMETMLLTSLPTNHDLLKNTYFANVFSFHNISEQLQLLHRYKNVMNNCDNYELNYIQQNKPTCAFQNCKWTMILLRSTLIISKHASTGLTRHHCFRHMLTFENI